MTDITALRDADLTLEQIEAIVRLVTDVWPSEDRTYAERLKEFRGWVESNRKTGFEVVAFVVWADGRAVAHARTFARTIRAGSADLTVMGLAGVCVAPDRRLEGLGKAVVLKAFERVDQGEFPVCLFQTQVADFYRKLGSRCVSNRFINRLNTEDPDKCPWWDPHIMIYPTGFDWPEGIIDLNGIAY
jgi:predicted N-acetyltransferase YhbS